MARKLFLSFLGASFYKKCTYTEGGFECAPTQFIQTATIERLTALGKKPDAIRIFVTDRAFTNNWDKTLTRRYDKDTQQEEEYIRLEAQLDNMQLGDSVKRVWIPNGGDEDQMWRIFDIVYQEIEEDDELYIDLTHAFRYLPMIVLVLSNYSKFLKHTHVEWLSYGNWEARDERMRAPIEDLLPITMLQDWTYAATDFLRHGYAQGLKEAVNDKLKPLLRDANLRTEAVVNVNSLASTIEKFAEERITCRGMRISSGQTIGLLHDKLNQMEDTGIAALNPIFHKLKETIAVPCNEPARCYEAAQWCYDRQLYQQAITILQEGINTFFCLRCGIKVDDEGERGKVGTAFKIKHDELACHEKGGRGIVAGEEDARLQALLKDELLNNHEVINHYTDLTGTRNDFNHAGFRSRRDPLEPKKIKGKIKEGLEFFKDILVNGEYVEREEAKRKIFLNISNHPSSSWEEKQRAAARQFGEIEELPFPMIDATASDGEIAALARETMDKIIRAFPHSLLTVHIMGEMTFTFALVTLLKARDIRCVASCTQRIVKDMDGGKRLSQFVFEQFREY